VLEIDPSSAPADYYIGRQLFAQGKIAEAASEFEKTTPDQRAVEGAPNIPFYLALCYVDPALREYDKAVRLLKPYVEGAAPIPAAYYHLGGAKYSLGERDDAVKQWHRGFSASAEQSRLLVEAGREAIKVRNIPRAQMLMEASLAALPYNLDAMVELARLRHARGGRIHALEPLEPALQLFPEEKRIYYLMAQVYEAERDFESAILNYNRYIVLEEDFDLVLEVDQKLQELRSSLPIGPVRIRPLWENISAAPEADTTIGENAER